MIVNLKSSSKGLRCITSGIIIAYVLFMCLLIYFWDPIVFFNNNSFQEDKKINVFIIGKAAIAQYLWQHLIYGDIELINNGFIQSGNKVFRDINFTYLSGPGYIQNTIPADIEYMVLVLNGRTSQNVAKAKEWLDYLPLMLYLRKVAVILLGNEQCENAWILKYMKTRGGVVDVLFVVYDSNIVNNKEIFQWPLGVATYRGFPLMKDINAELILKKRAYRCNFVGTVYENSSRETLMEMLLKSPFRTMCYILPRRRWVPEETSASLHDYVNALQNSDFTLCPVGVNTECYRIYEAISLGSIPVIEDRMTPGKCDSPLSCKRLSSWRIGLGKVPDYGPLIAAKQSPSPFPRLLLECDSQSVPFLTGCSIFIVNMKRKNYNFCFYFHSLSCHSIG